jgi:predicted dehydrogenase
VPVSAAADAVPVGVVGVGHLGRHHARLWAAHPGARLVGVVDTDQDRAREIASLHGCAVFADVRELVGRVRAASVAVPTAAHREVAVALIEAGIDVLVEKPLAPSLAEADAIVEAAARRAALVMVGHSERFHPAVRALAREVERPRFFEIHRLAAFTARSTDVDVVLDLMVHDLDLVLWLDGTEPVSIDAVGVAALTDKVDIANARVRMASGCVANLTASRISTEPVRRVRVFQERTYLACDSRAGTVERYRVVMRDGGPAIEHDRLAIAEGEPLALEIDAFLAAVRSRSKPPVDGRDGRNALAAALAVRDAMVASRRG